jgi:hypothetical protein
VCIGVSLLAAGWVFTQPSCNKTIFDREFNIGGRFFAPEGKVEKQGACRPTQERLARTM